MKTISTSVPQINLASLTKLEAPAEALLVRHTDTEIWSAIIEVTEPNYVPEGVTVRARIDATLLTGEFSAEWLKVIQQDERIKKVSVAKKLMLVR